MVDEIETVGIRQLSRSLSSYIKNAALGIRVFITDHGKVVAELRELSGEIVQEAANPVTRDLVTRNQLSIGSHRKISFKRGNALAPKCPAASLINELRGD